MLHQHSTVEGPQHVIIAKSTYQFSKHITISFDVENTQCFTIEKRGEKYLQLKCTYFGHNFRIAENTFLQSLPLVMYASTTASLILGRLVVNDTWCSDVRHTTHGLPQMKTEHLHPRVTKILRYASQVKFADSYDFSTVALYVLSSTTDHPCVGWPWRLLMAR
jgi:hypothetical protein